MLITGGCGFIGSNFLHHMSRAHPDFELINLDKLSYAGNPDNLKALEKEPNYRFVQGDISDETLVQSLMEKHQVLTLVHFAAESHVDRSIEEAKRFVETNVLGTQVLHNSSL